MTEGKDATKRPDAGILRIEETAEREIEADGAVLHIVVEGQRLLFGNAAIEQCREVKDLTTQLKQLGIENDQIDVVSVQTSSEKTLLSKSSSARYELNVRVDELGLLSDALGVVGGQKQIRLEQIEWLYEKEREVLLELSAEAVARARAKAGKMAAALGVEVLGVRSCSDSHRAPAPQVTAMVTAPEMRAAGAVKRKRAAPADIGTTFQSRRKISAMCAVEFWVGSNQVTD